MHELERQSISMHAKNDITKDTIMNTSKKIKENYERKLKGLRALYSATEDQYTGREIKRIETQLSENQKHLDRLDIEGSYKKIMTTIGSK